ncbi:O-antigen ligase family protein [Sphingorhabdus lacus]|jgi:O-antigen ligase|uniref:O-antigen ligase family protein n=1 Tax=Sphingorhabdus lacus TaxID=392610 RepID=A0A6I6L674_9SPHN|nr:O-antigen ligase family protein [Sphingorhabdus lacus]QGY81319.1 O-antigen ligase family protein [Sphingorhabdus lacus]
MVSKLKTSRWQNVRPQFWILSAFLLLVFFTGGSARPDVQSLVVLRPIAVLLCAVAVFTLTAEHVKSNKAIFSFLAALSAIIILHSIPFPNGLVILYSKAHIPANVLELASYGEWIPFSAAPEMTSNTIFSFFVPVTVLALAVQLDREERFLLLYLLIGLALLSSIFAIFQAVAGYGSPFHLYRLTNEGAAVGLFANRNHQALLLSALFPMLMVFAYGANGGTKPRRWRLNFAIAAGSITIPLLLITGSRTGLLLGFVCLASFPLFYKLRIPGEVAVKGKSIRGAVLRLTAALGAVGLLVVVTVFASRAEAIKRIFTGNNGEDTRWAIWEHALHIAWNGFPIGSGSGSFARMYQLYEEDSGLTSSYVNQAHNDWLDVFLTLGVSGIVLATCMIFWVLRLSYAAMRHSPRSSRDAIFARLGMIILFSAAIASFFDYPMRTPIFNAVGIIAYLWLDGIRNTNATPSGPPPSV